MRVHLCLGQESPQALCPSLCSHLRAPCLLEWWQLGHLWRALTLMQCRTQCTIWLLAFLPRKNPEPKNLQIALLLRGLFIFLFPSYWSRTVDLLHFKPAPEGTGRICTCKMEKKKKKTFFDFQLLLSFNSYVVFFFPFSSFSHPWWNTGNYFLYLNSRRECFFILFLYVSRDTSHFLKGCTGGWVRAPPRTEVLETLCPVVLWSLTSWTDVKNQWPASHSWYCWPVQNRQIYYCF